MGELEVKLGRSALARFTAAAGVLGIADSGLFSFVGAVAVT